MENDGPKLRGFRDSLVNDKLENNNMATAASSGIKSRRPQCNDMDPQYIKNQTDGSNGRIRYLPAMWVSGFVSYMEKWI